MRTLGQIYHDADHEHFPYTALLCPGRIFWQDGKPGCSLCGDCCREVKIRLDAMRKQ